MYRAGLPRPGARLLAAAELVRPGRVVADIGCDHGKLAVYLAMSGRAPRVIATDIRPLPLGKARALVAQTGCQGKVECRLGDGLAPLVPGEVQEIVIAGMSGETMANVLAAVPWVRDESLHFVLLPAARAERLRRWLCENGFSIKAETPVEEHGKYYTALSVNYTGTPNHEGDELYYELGRLPETRGPAAAGFIERRLTHLRRRAAAPLEEGQRHALEKLTNEVEACLQSVK